MAKIGFRIHNPDKKRKCLKTIKTSWLPRMFELFVKKYNYFKSACPAALINELAPATS